ncbi:hypothetical protein SAMN04487947_1226 [Halogeometricum rufum]|uniref:Uncharacterized protein n=1 Tax=Halogeometricum rufum TaxID=553469 RepID=A0A1I6GJ06_9EURY|nr:BppU family phage baseplate upper protein [Halogeometricum rufum]SFR42119.1 hypothetical protein SAMN04487947_1226 [Halogeometricum rufum]
MPATAHTRKPSDDHSKFTYTLTDSDGAAIDVSSVTSVDLYVEDDAGSTVISGQAATIEDGANGVVSFVFGTTELDSAGTYHAEFVINRNSGTSYQHVPAGRNLRIDVVEEVQTGTPTIAETSTPDYQRKPGDDYTALTHTLTDRDGNAIDVSSATAVTVWADAPDESAELSGASTTNVTDGSDGQVTYDVQSGDFAAAGDYSVEFVIEYGDGSYRPVPHDSNIHLEVAEDVK